MAVLTWPSLLPNVQRAGNARAPVDLSLRSTMPLGAPQGRQRFSRPRETCPVSMILDGNGLAFLDAYWHWYLNQGCAWVVLPLRGELGTAATYARFIGQYEAKETGGRWTVTMTAELENPSHTAGLLVCQDPTFSPPAGVLNGTTSLTIASGTAGATIYYTVDGSTPTRSSTLYTGPISLVGTAAITVKALAVKTGYEDSLPASATYTFATCATPVITPGAGIYTSTQSVTLSTTTAGASIYYTTDGSTPNATKTLYTGAFNVSTTTTVKAIAIKASLFDSAVASASLAFLAGSINGITFNGEVHAAAVNGSILYVGGSFTSITDAGGAHSRTCLAAIDLSTGLVTSFAAGAGASAEVYVLRIDSSGRLWVGGLFTACGGLTRNYLVRYDATATIETVNFGINAGGGGYVTDIAFDASTGRAFIAGSWDTSTGAGTGHANLLVFSSSDTVVSAGPNVTALATPRTVKISGGVIYVGGAPSTHAAVAYDLTTYAAKTWTVDITGAASAVETLLIANGVMYVGGRFTTCQGVSRTNVAVVDLTTATLQSFAPAPNALIEAGYGLDVDANNVVYFFGNFTTIGGSSRAGAAAFDATGTIKTGWNPGLTVSPDVYGMVVGGLVYMFGTFTNPSGGTRLYVIGIA